MIAAGADLGLLDDQRYDAVTIAAVRDGLSTPTALLFAGASAKLITSVYDGAALIAAADLGHDGRSTGSNLTDGRVAMIRPLGV